MGIEDGPAERWRKQEAMTSQSASDRGRVRIDPAIYVILLAFFVISRTNYLVFHTVVETFTIVVAFSVFVFVLNARPYFDNDYFEMIGIGYLFVATIDLIHTLAYPGMGTFGESTTNLATQLWLAGRFLQTATFLLAPLFLKRRLNRNLALLAFAVATGILLASILHWGTFPEAFREGFGLTAFKKISEYAIALAMLVSAVILFRLREAFESNVFRLLIASVLLAIAAEVNFTFYSTAFDIFNFIGHLFKFLSFYLMYKAVIETGLTRPYALLFRNLQEREEALQRQTIALQERNEELDAFSHTVAHELGDSLASLDSSIRALSSEALPEQDRKDFQEGVIRTVHRMGDIIDGLLLLAEVRKTAIKLMPVDMHVVTSNAEERFSHIIRERRAILTKPSEWPMALGSAVWLEEVWANLISNALKYGGDPPELQLGADDHAPQGQVRFWLRDNGSGLTQKEMNRLFRPFTQIQSGQAIGHGLGLSIIRRIIKKMGGTVGVESKVGEGALFFFTLPAASDLNAAAEPDAEKQLGGALI
jgi:signal transduction histidine kinase